MVTLLSGCGYYVDYVENRSEGIEKFRNFKHAVIILDVQAIPRSPHRLLRLFSQFKKNPIILVLAEKKDEEKLYPFMHLGVFDVVSLPLNLDYLYFVLKRLITFSKLSAKAEFSKFFIGSIMFSIPIWLFALWYLSRNMVF
jgi:DNA-binding response OmpR family regulator